MHVSVGYRQQNAGLHPGSCPSQQRENATSRRNFLYDGDTPVVEESYSGSTATISAVNVWGADGWRGRYYPGIPNFYSFAFDPQGNVIEKQQAIATSLPAYTITSFEAYGKLGANLLYSTGGSQGPGNVHQAAPAGFGGEWGYYTDETGYINLTHRYYDPGTGRFINRDPIGYNGGVNLYELAGGNPVTGTDSRGLAQDVGGGDDTVRLSLAAFIPTNHTLGGFNGDGRPFSSNSPAYRLEQNVVVNLKGGTVDVLPGREGDTHLLGTLGTVNPADHMTGRWRRTPTGGYNITLEGRAENGLARKMMLGAHPPPIQYDVHILLNSRGVVTYYQSTMTNYPAFELYEYRNGSAPQSIFAAGAQKGTFGATGLFGHRSIQSGL